MVTKTRKELMVTTEDHGGYLSGHCALCGDCGWLDSIKHKKNCLLRDPGITHVRMIVCRAKIVLWRSGGKLWWRSGLSSKKTYDIERRGSYYVMQERKSGKVIKDHALLRDIRQFIKDNQGVL